MSAVSLALVQPILLVNSNTQLKLNYRLKINQHKLKCVACETVQNDTITTVSPSTSWTNQLTSYYQ
jgi:hypothetical protein